MKDPILLQPDEKIIVSFRKHWFILFLRIVGVLVSTVVPFVLYAIALAQNIVPPGMRAAHVFEFAGYFWLIAMWWTLSSIWTKYYLEMWVVTNRRVIGMRQIEFFDREVTAWGIERILEVNVHVGNFIETLLNYGSLEIHTAGPDGENDEVHGIPDPEHIREMIMTQANWVNSLEEANRNQEKLIHTISHEVKGYLTKDAASLAYIAEGTGGGKDPTELKSFAERALGETRKGVSAIMDMLSGADTKSGSMRMANDVVDLKLLVHEVYEASKSTAERKHLAFSISVTDGAYIIRGDKVKLRDLVLRNVIDNALHYTKVGGVKIELSRNSDHATLAVSDSGVGISPDDMKKLFTPGGHGEHSKEVNPESTGFGLADAKQIVTAHRGTITVKSEGSGKGSTFLVTLPLSV